MTSSDINVIELRRVGDCLLQVLPSSWMSDIAVAREVERIQDIISKRSSHCHHPNFENKSNQTDDLFFSTRVRSSSPKRLRPLLLRRPRTAPVRTQNRQSIRETDIKNESCLSEPILCIVSKTDEVIDSRPEYCKSFRRMRSDNASILDIILVQIIMSDSESCINIPREAFQLHKTVVNMSSEAHHKQLSKLLSDIENLFISTDDLVASVILISSVDVVRGCHLFDQNFPKPFFINDDDHRIRIISSSTSGESGAVEELVNSERSPHLPPPFFLSRDEVNSYIELTLRDELILPKSYTLCSAHPIISGYHLRSWKLLGTCTLEGHTRPWTILSSHSNDKSLCHTSSHETWDLDNSLTFTDKQLFFNKFRLQQTGPNALGTYSLQLSGIEIRGRVVYTSRPVTEHWPAPIPIELAVIKEPVVIAPASSSPAQSPRQRRVLKTAVQSCQSILRMARAVESVVEVKAARRGSFTPFPGMPEIPITPLGRKPPPKKKKKKK